MNKDVKRIGTTWRQNSPNGAIRTVKPEHFMRKYQGFGISDKTISELQEHGIKELTFKYLGSEKITLYKCELSQFVSSQLIHSFGADTQRFVKTKDMKEYKQDGIQL